MIETPRLLIRPWKDSDLLPFAQLNADPLVMEYFPKLLSFEESKTMVDIARARSQKHGFCFSATELRATGEFIGFIGLNVPDYQTPFSPFVEVGWRIASAHWNKGYATEGALAVLDHGFNELKLQEIVSFTARQNVRSERIMQKIGMVKDPEGNFHHPSLPVDHELSEHVLYRTQNPRKV